jgi:hypothetical protein
MIAIDDFEPFTALAARTRTMVTGSHMFVELRILHRLIA